MTLTHEPLANLIRETGNNRMLNVRLYDLKQPENLSNDNVTDA